MELNETLTCALVIPNLHIIRWEEEPSPLLTDAMAKCLLDAERSLEQGGIPDAAALINLASGNEWYALSDYAKTGNLLGHAALNCYEQAQTEVTDKLDKCVLISTVEPCGTCAGVYLQGRIGTIVMAATNKQLTREDGSQIVPQSAFGLANQVKKARAATVIKVGLGSAQSIDLMRQWDQQQQADA